MTNVNFDIKIQQTIEGYITAAAAGAGRAPGAASGTAWNWATPADDAGLSNENIYSANIPHNSDGTINFNALYTQLEQLIKYAINGDQADYNSQLNIAAMLMNIGNVWSQLSPQDQQHITNLLNPANGPSLLSEMSPDMLRALIYGTFYANNGDRANTTSAVSDLIRQMQQAFGGIPVFANFLASAQELAAPSQLNLWMAQHTNADGTADLSFAGFVFLQTRKWESDFSYMNSNDSSNAMINEMNTGLINTLLDGVTNPWEIVEILFCSFFCNSGLPDYMTQIAGSANLTNAVTNVGKDAQSVQAFFNANAGKFTWAQAQTFFNDVSNLNALGNGDLRIAGTIGSATNQLYNTVYNPKSSVQVQYTVPGSTPPTVLNIPIGELYQSALTGARIVNPSNGKVYGPCTQADFLTALNSLSANSGSSSITPAGYTQIQTDLGQVETAVTAKTSAVGQVTSNLMATVQKFEALLTAIGNSITQVEKTMTTASASASS
jgi:hypothetical protein